MAMMKPIGYSVSAFDATQNQVFKFDVQGGSQVNYNEIIIRNNTTNAVAYQNKIQSFVFSQTVPSNTLSNGIYYNYSFITYDVNDNASEPSTPIPFYCYTTPTVVFTNLPSDNILQNASFQFVIQYNQTEGENLKRLNIYLYDSNNNIIDSSGDLTSVMIPPINFVYNVNGLFDEERYYIQVVAETQYDTIVYSNKEELFVNYESPIIFNLVDLTNNCEKGYVTVTNNNISIDGESNPTPPHYLNDERIDLVNYDTWVQWTKGYNFSNQNYSIGIWMSPAQLGNFIEMWNSTQNIKLYGKLTREIPYGETEPKDCFELNGYNGLSQTLYQFSNYINMINNLKNIVIWIKRNEDEFTLTLSEFTQSDNYIIWNEGSNVQYNIPSSLLWVGESSPEAENQLQWNTLSNVEYNRVNTIFWQNETKAPIVVVPKVAYNNDTEFTNITNVKLYNGIFDNFYISRDGTKVTTLEKPTWDYYTTLSCDFDNNINGGNINYLLTQLNSMRVKHRKIGTYQWITLDEIPIETYEDLNFSVIDKYTPSGIPYEWAIVPVMNGNIEGNYSTNTLTPKFDGVFIIDSDNVYRLYNGVLYNGDTSVQAQGQLQPFGSKYPILVENSNVDYQMGSITGTLFNDEFYDTRQIDRNKIVQLKENFDKFLKNKKFKVWKDWNGNIKLFKVSGSPTIAYNNAYGNGIVNTTFAWVEQGDVDNKQDLYELGFIKSNI